MLSESFAPLTPSKLQNRSHNAWMRASGVHWIVLSLLLHSALFLILKPTRQKTDLKPPSARVTVSIQNSKAPKANPVAIKETQSAGRAPSSAATSPKITQSTAQKAAPSTQPATTIIPAAHTDSSQTTVIPNSNSESQNKSNSSGNVKNGPSDAPSSTSNSKNPASSGESGSADINVLKNYAKSLAQRIGQEKNYPNTALQLGMEGIVKIRIRMNRLGRLVGEPKIEQSSGYELLDQEALRTILNIGQFDPPPMSQSKNEIEFIIPTSFHIN